MNPELDRLLLKEAKERAKQRLKDDAREQRRTKANGFFWVRSSSDDEWKCLHARDETSATLAVAMYHPDAVEMLRPDGSIDRDDDADITFADPKNPTDDEIGRLILGTDSCEI